MKKALENKLNEMLIKSGLALTVVLMVFTLIRTVKLYF